LGEALQAAAEAGKLRTIDLSLSWSARYTLAGGIVGGALLSAASHGTDHLIVQRVLATGGVGAARKAMIGSGLLVIVQFALFLLVGTLLWAAGADDPAVAGDSIYPRFVVEHLPPGVSGLVVAGLLAAAMSTVSSSLSSLASATTHDLYSPLSGERRPEKLLAFGRRATLGWALVLGGGALAFRSDQPVVELALTIASISYGGLLGAYLLAGVRRVRQVDVLAAIAVSVGSMLSIWLLKPGALGRLAMPWYVPLGLAIALVVGLARVPRRR
jgi:Na+/proline symporter